MSDDNQDSQEKSLKEILELRVASSKMELLTCSARDYAASQGRDLTAYTLIGIYSDNRDKQEGTSRTCIKMRAFEKGCEVVVDLKVVYGTLQYHEGTGMKLKEEP